MRRGEIQPCRFCGAPIRLVQLIPTRIRPGTERKSIPLEPIYDESRGIAPSHAMNFGQTRCHPITADHPLEAHEIPALTHFALCPARPRPVSTATEGTP